MQQEESLDLYLSGLRRTAKLSVEQVCAQTKIQARYVQALEEARWGDVPSNTHLRAFSLAIAKACGGEEARASDLVRRVMTATAPAVQGPLRSFDTPAPALSAVKSPVPSGAPVLAATADLPRDGAPALAPASSLAAASARLRSLPLAALLALLAVAGTLSYAAAWGVETWRQRLDLAALAAPEPKAATGAEAPAPAVAVKDAPAAQPASKAGTAAASAASVAVETAAPAGAELLTLRARRPCWLVLQIDGKRLPTVTLQDGDKLNWSVGEKAVMLAGNVGALRVWWNNDNLGYLGELGSRANAIVFERGKAPRFDKSAALKLPPGVPD